MRRSGILMHLTSLPGPGGIGTMGKEAYEFADFLHKAGMTIWQVLPVGPVGYGESPYQSSSVFAGNPLMISVEKLADEGLLTLSAADAYASADDAKVDYEAVRVHKEKLLRRCCSESFDRLKSDVEAFAMENAWVRDYALFISVKAHFGGAMWTKWPDDDIRMHRKAAVAKYSAELADEVNYHIFVQYLFFRQWFALKKYVNDLGIRFFGDMPIYVAEDSADTWTRPEVFQLDKNRIPKRVAGVPPDYFSEDGQLWGNPLYRWTALFFRGYDWWVDRMKANAKLFDMIRIDHFIGFANYYSIPYGAPNARNGKWVIGPGKHLFRRLNKELPGLEIIAEDLGAVNDRVRALLNYVGYPGMRVMCFGFGGDHHENPHYPANYIPNSVVYTGTHDNDTILGWLKSANAEDLQAARECLKFDDITDAPAVFVKAALASPCNVAVVPMQDVLGLGTEARMNLPGSIGGNWRWRMLPGAATNEIAAELKKLNQETHRGN